MSENLIIDIIPIVMGLILVVIVALIIIFLLSRKTDYEEREDDTDSSPNDDTRTPSAQTDNKRSDKVNANERPSIIIEAKEIKRTGKDNDRRSPMSFMIPKGSIVYIVGKSGIGKSVLLKILCGYEKRYTGTFSVISNDTKYNWHQNEYALKRYISYVPQDNDLYDEVSPVQLLKTYSLLFPTKKMKSLTSTVDKVIKDVSLENVKHKKIKELSGGQKKRVSIAIELLRRPGILILDEPDSGLDPDNRKFLYSLLKRYSGEGMTVIISTHYYDHIMDNDLVLGFKIEKSRAGNDTIRLSDLMHWIDCKKDYEVSF